MSSLFWLGKTLCPPDCLVKSDIKAPSYSAIFRLGIVVLQCVCMGEVFYGLHVAHVHIICPVSDVIHVRKCTRPSPAFPYYKRWKAGRGPGNESITENFHGVKFLGKQGLYLALLLQQIFKNDTSNMQISTKKSATLIDHPVTVLTTTPLFTD